jgi:integrase
MSEERSTAPVTGEAWAAAQVEAVARKVEARERRAKQRPAKARGVWFRERPGGEVLGPNGTRGEWWACWFDVDGQKHREKAGTKSAALALYQRRKTEVRQGRHFPERLRQIQAVTLKVVCDDYTAALRANHRDRRGQAAVRLAEVSAMLGDRKADRLTAQDVERLKARLSQTPAERRGTTRTPATVNRFLQDLRAAYNLARRNGKVERNPVADVRLLRENNKRTRELSADEEARLLAALDPAGRRKGTADLRAFVRLTVETGLREGEACALREEDVDWTAGFAALPETKAGEKQHVPLSPEALAILRSLEPRGGYFFAWPDGRPWSPGFVTHALGKAIRRAGIPDLRPHDLRHTFACRRLRAGVDLFTVSRLLRHASTAMSERYVHLTRGDLKVAAGRSVPVPSDPTGDTGREARS